MDEDEELLGCVQDAIVSPTKAKEARMSLLETMIYLILKIR